LSSKEMASDEHPVLQAVDSQTVALEGVGDFPFDVVWEPGSQDDVFDACSDLVDAAIAGERGSILVMGQAGTGRTLTTFGRPGDEGLVPKVAKALFERLEGSAPGFTVTTSFMQLYRSELVDLLARPWPDRTLRPRVSRDRFGDVVVEPLLEAACIRAEDMTAAAEGGISASIMTSTAMGVPSGSCHRIFIIKVAHESTGTGKLVICDLAECPCYRVSKCPLTDSGRELIEIAKSFTALGDVTEAILRGSRAVPYRNHRLTQVLQDCLSRDSKAVFVVTCTPASSWADGTHQLLKFASRHLNLL